jgi:hypothetical protein
VEKSVPSWSSYTLCFKKHIGEALNVASTILELTYEHMHWFMISNHPLA